MAGQAGSSGGVSGGMPNVFTRGFLPGLVLGIVIGAVIGFMSTEIIGKGPKFDPVPGGSTASTMQETHDRDGPGQTPSREELEKMAREAHEAAEAEGGETTPSDDDSSADEPEGDG